MRKLITEVKDVSGNDYQLYAELIDVANPVGSKMLSFSSVWTGAKDPKLEQNKCRFTLNASGIANLKELLESQ